MTVPNIQGNRSQRGLGAASENVRLLVYGESSHGCVCRQTRSGSVTANPAYDSDPDDPVEILHILPEEYHAQFRAEYAAAVDGARRLEQFHKLQEMLRLWRLRAVAYTSPGYRERLIDAPEEHTSDAVPATQLIPSWPGGRQTR